MDVQEKRLEPQPAVVIRTKARADALGPAMGELFPAVLGFVLASPAEPEGPPFCRYLAMDGEEWEIECGMAVSEAVAGEGRIEATELPGGAAVTTMHVGPYETLGQSWEVLQGWVAQNGKAAAAAPWEVYWTDPGEVQDPAQWRTEIVIPVEG